MAFYHFLGLLLVYIKKLPSFKNSEFLNYIFHHFTQSKPPFLSNETNLHAYIIFIVIMQQGPSISMVCGILWHSLDDSVASSLPIHLLSLHACNRKPQTDTTNIFQLLLLLSVVLVLVKWCRVVALSTFSHFSVEPKTQKKRKQNKKKLKSTMKEAMA